RAISVVVCAYTRDRGDDLAAAVRSLQQQSRPPAEIIVVSDHNPHLFARVAAAWSDVIALENEERRGLSGARNTGVRAARGEIIAFLDDDATAEPDWLRLLIAAYDERSVVGVGGAILPRWESGRPGWFPEEFDWVVGCTYKGMPLARSRQRNLIGANMSFRRELFATAGDFQTDMGRIGTRPLGCEETELCIRGAQRMPGTQYVYEPLAKVQHRVPAGRSTWRYFVSRCYAEGLSKAQVAGRVGSDAGLASERQYATRTLPAGVLHGVTDALVHGHVAGLGRAAAILAGLAITAAGYVRGRLAMPRSYHTLSPATSTVALGTTETTRDGKAHSEVT
ncbi:MAG: glycosyltransferase family 2 protein, partial [Nitrososphaerales archaeon]